jgi:hypothetical protein
MANSVQLQSELRDSIAEEIEARIRRHQADVTRLKSAAAVLEAAGAPPPMMPLSFLANGDSWFDYPLNGNSFPSPNTDIVAHLKTMGTVHPLILSLAHHGDATTDEMGLTKQQRMIKALGEKANWMAANKRPDAILFSGGGNDIAGEQFCIFLDYNLRGASGLNAQRFGGKLRAMEASYRDLFAFRDRYAEGVPIFGHCYDWAMPNGKHPPCAGPWLKPSLDFTGWTDAAVGAAIVRSALEAFREMLMALANDAANRFILIDTQGTLVVTDWANELHPFPNGFAKLASKYIEALRNEFPGRI